MYKDKEKGMDKGRVESIYNHPQVQRDANEIRIVFTTGFIDRVEVIEKITFSYGVFNNLIGITIKED